MSTCGDPPGYEKLNLHSASPPNYSVSEVSAAVDQQPGNAKRMQLFRILVQVHVLVEVPIEAVVRVPRDSPPIAQPGPLVGSADPQHTLLQIPQ